jgi:putative membrane protein
MKLKSILLLFIAGSLLTQLAFSGEQTKTLEQLAYMPSDQGSLTKEEQNEDRRILGIIMAIDQSEIAAAHNVVHKKTSQNVRRYAKYLYRQHSANLRGLDKVAKSTGLDPSQSTTSTMLTKQGEQELTKLSGLDNKALESEYINAMVSCHQAGLHLIDTDLFKKATGFRLKAYVMKTRDMIYHHLVRAVAIQKQLA